MMCAFVFLAMSFVCYAHLTRPTNQDGARQLSVSMARGFGDMYVLSRDDGHGFDDSLSCRASLDFVFDRAGQSDTLLKGAVSDACR